MTEFSHADRLRANTAARIAREAAEERALFAAQIDEADFPDDVKADARAALNEVSDINMAATDMAAIEKALKARGLVTTPTGIVRI